MSRGIEGKVVVITGASSGLGAAAARHLATAGAKLVLGARREDRLTELVKDLGGDRALAVHTDVTNRDQVKALVAAAVARFGRLDVLINNAGIMPQSLVEHLRIDEWDRTIDVNIKGVLYGIAAALPVMIRQKGGQIINVSSVAGHIVHPGTTVYAATKTAVRVLSEGVRQEVKPYGIRVAVISPGAVQSELPATTADPDVAPRVAKFYADHAIGADSFARAVAFAIEQPDDVDVNEILFRPTTQPL